jgi:phage/plasmid-associated DNA primase
VDDVIKSLVSAEACQSVKFFQLGSRFECSKLVGKSVCFMPETEASQWDDLGSAVATFKAITGRDLVDIEFKGDPIAKTMELGVRFVLSSNDVPRFPDTSGAFANRIVPLRFTRLIGESEKDPRVREALLAETPGIVWWALRGLLRVYSKPIPKIDVCGAARLVLDDMRDRNNVVRLWVADECVFDESVFTPSAELFAGIEGFELGQMEGQPWKLWCKAQEQTSGNLAGFVDRLVTAFPKLKKERKTIGGERIRGVMGLRLRGLSERLPDAGEVRHAMPASDAKGAVGGARGFKVVCKDVNQHADTRLIEEDGEVPF